MPSGAESGRLDRPGRVLHRGQQAVDQVVVEFRATVQKALEGRSLEPDGVEDGLALGSAGEAVEVGEEVPEKANALRSPVVGQEGAEQSLELSATVPVRAGRRRRRPLRESVAVARRVSRSRRSNRSLSAQVA